MTDDETALRALLEQGSDATFLREVIGFAAGCLMQLETGNLCGGDPDERVTTFRCDRPGFSPTARSAACTRGDSHVPRDPASFVRTHLSSAAIA